MMAAYHRIRQSAAGLAR